MKQNHTIGIILSPNSSNLYPTYAFPYLPS